MKKHKNQKNYNKKDKTEHNIQLKNIPSLKNTDLINQNYKNLLELKQLSFVYRLLFFGIATENNIISCQ